VILVEAMTFAWRTVPIVRSLRPFEPSALRRRGHWQLAEAEAEYQTGLRDYTFGRSAESE
jgi:hypothetical protein